MRRITLAFVALAPAWQPEAATALIFGPDDRITVGTRPGSPYAPIGIVYLSSANAYVTGFLVDRCRVMTVKHVVASAKGRRVKFAVGELGNSNFREVSGGTVVDVGVAPSLEPQTEVGPGDWALIRLDRCLGKRFGFVELDSKGAKAGDSIAMAGYPGDKDKQAGLSLDPECKIHALERSMAKHDCAVQSGNSGSPIFRRYSGSTGRLVVVAMNSAGWTYGVPNATLILPVEGYNSAYANQAVPVSAWPQPR